MRWQREIFQKFQSELIKNTISSLCFFVVSRRFFRLLLLLLLFSFPDHTPKKESSICMHKCWASTPPRDKESTQGGDKKQPGMYSCPGRYILIEIFWPFPLLINLFNVLRRILERPYEVGNANFRLFAGLQFDFGTKSRLHCHFQSPR